MEPGSSCPLLAGFDRFPLVDEIVAMEVLQVLDLRFRQRAREPRRRPEPERARRNDRARHDESARPDESGLADVRSVEDRRPDPDQAPATDARRRGRSLRGRE